MKLNGIPTGFFDFDYESGGLVRGELVTIAGVPGTGATSLALNICVNSASVGCSCLVFAPTLGKSGIARRMVANYAEIDFQSLDHGYLSRSQWNRFKQSIKRIGNLPVFIDDTLFLTVEHILEVVSERAGKDRIDIIILDGLEALVSSGNNSHDGIITTLKNLARKNNAAILVTLGLDPNIGKQVDQRPKLSDFGEWDPAVQHSDVVILLHREDLFNKDTASKNIAELFIAKHRNGSNARFELFFKEESARFESLSRVLTDYHDISIVKINS